LLWLSWCRVLLPIARLAGTQSRGRCNLLNLPRRSCGRSTESRTGRP
jgi:hypothetical protein